MRYLSICGQNTIKSCILLCIISKKIKRHIDKGEHAMLMPQWLGLIGGIILVDLVLSGDNALVIGAAASGLPREQRWSAIAIGGAGAIILRVVFAVVATFLLQLPLLQAIGGALLLIIALRLLADRSH